MKANRGLQQEHQTAGFLYLDAAGELGVVQQPDRAKDLLIQGADAGAAKPEHFHP